MSVTSSGSGTGSNSGKTTVTGFMDRPRCESRPSGSGREGIKKDAVVYRHGFGDVQGTSRARVRRGPINAVGGGEVVMKNRHHLPLRTAWVPTPGATTVSERRKINTTLQHIPGFPLSS